VADLCDNPIRTEGLERLAFWITMLEAKRNRRWLLSLEFFSLFIFLPVVLYILRMRIAFFVLPLVILTAAGCSAYLFPAKGFPSANFWRTEKLPTHIRSILLTFILPATAASLWTYCALEDRFLVFPHENPYLWPAFLLYYPVFAAYPQEIIFRGFFFQRYETLFPNQSVMVMVNGLCFGWAHLMYGNWIAPTLSTFGGILFAYRYIKTRSLLIVGIEHGLWGNFLLTVGLGWFFCSGSIG
jgi:uncharacterized protein